MKDENVTEEEFLESYDLREFPAMALTVDITLFTIHKGKLSVLMVKRGGHPEKNKWALPGGFVNTNESTEEAVYRELMEETLIDVESSYVEQLKTYAYPGRDPRGYIASVAYVALAPINKTPIGSDDAIDARFFPVDEVLENGFINIAFDHAQIIKDGLDRVRAKIEYAPVAVSFLKDNVFTISELREVYEIIWGIDLVPSNFRRKVLSIANFLEPTGERRQSTILGGRSSELYKIGKVKEFYPPFKNLTTIRMF